MAAKVRLSNRINMKIPDFYSNFKIQLIRIKQFFVLLLFFALSSSQLTAQKAEPYDILITEFMPDPLPTIGLPNSEFIELYNRSTKTFNLNGFKLNNGAVKTTLPNFMLKSESYVIIYTRKSTVNFGNLGDTLPVSKLISLSNPGDTFYLQSPEDVIIDAASFDVSMFQNSKKADGGWSLERPNINAPCLINNWIATNDLKGGTPGQKNSVYNNTIDKTPPHAIYTFPKDDKTIILKFDKSLSRDIAVQSIHYQLDNNIDLNKIKIEPPMFDIVELSLTKPLAKNKLYQLVLKTGLKDCNNTPLSIKDTIPIQLPEKAEHNDLIVNELLMNPETGGSRFVEFYNRSDKVIDLAELKIADISKGDIKSITTHYALFPKSYVVVTESPLYIQNRYKAKNYQQNFLKNRLPTWHEDEGNATIYSVHGLKNVIIDSFNYNKNFHNPLLANTEGVSLERISLDESTNNASNWHSAAASVAYATPGYQNSQFHLTPSVSAANDIFTLAHNSFSPDEDGFQDYLLLDYQVDKAGYFANISIFNIEGSLVKKLTINELLSTKGQIKWGGETDDNQKAAIGAYIIYFELTSPDGEIKKLKKVCILAEKF